MNVVLLASIPVLLVIAIRIVQASGNHRQRVGHRAGFCAGVEAANELGPQTLRPYSMVRFHGALWLVRTIRYEQRLNEPRTGVIEVVDPLSVMPPWYDPIIVTESPDPNH